MDELTRIENASILAFVQSAADGGYLTGRVLDYGSGAQPYRNIVEAGGGIYYPYDRAEFPANMSGRDLGEDDPFYYPDQHQWDAVLCTQVLQYDREPGGLLSTMYEDAFVKGGHLVLTYPTNWPIVDAGDLHRFTKNGMERLLTEAGFTIIRHEQRASFEQYGYEWPFGYGVIARA